MLNNKNKYFYFLQLLLSGLLLFSFVQISFAAEVPYGVMPSLGDGIKEPSLYPEVIEKKADKPQAATIDEPGAPRMQLKGFTIEGVVERPELGITLGKIQLLADEEAYRIAPYEASTGFSIGMLEKITSIITRYYRQKGFFLARAYIPEQTVKDGIVKISVMESALGIVAFDGNDLYADELLKQPFENIIGQAVFKDDIESALYTLSDYPGLEVKGIFGPGTQPGTAALLVRVDEAAIEGFVSVDNYGSVFTGENRIHFSYVINNAFGMADFLAFNLLPTLSPQNALYADVLYSLPVISSSYRAGGGLQMNQFEVGGDLKDLNIAGDTLVAYGFFSKQFIRSRTERLMANTGLYLKSAISKVGGNVSSEDKLTVIDFEGFYSGINPWLARSYHESSLHLSVGLGDFLGSTPSGGDALSSRTTGSGKKAGGDFMKINFSYFNLYKINELQSLLFRFDAQHTSDILMSLEQYSLGGVNSVRAYPTAEVLVDKASFFSFEWIVSTSPDYQLPWIKNLNTSVYLDYAKGTVIDPLVNEVATATLGGIGLGFETRPNKKFKARVDLTLSSIGDKPSDNQSLPFYFRMEYRF